MISEVQSNGHIREGDLRIHAFSIGALILTGRLFHETFGAVRVSLPDLYTIARQHSRTILCGLLTVLPDNSLPMFQE